MDRNGKFQNFLNEKRREALRRLYRRCMTCAGGAALALSLLSGCLTFGVRGLRDLAEETAFSPKAGDGAGAGDGSGAAQDASLSLFLSPSGALAGDLPFGGLLFPSDESSAGGDGGESDAGSGREPEENDPPADSSSDSPKDNPSPPPSTGDAGVQKITARDLSPGTARSLVNMTSTLDPDLEKIYAAYQTKNAAGTVPTITEKAPLVLILHTHSTESYAPEGASSLPAGSAPRSLSPEESVIAVGNTLTETLEARGVPTLHCTFGHDLEDYSGAYDREKATILAYLKEYPSIRYIFDVHRDSIEQSDGSIVKTKATVNGQTAAQIMFVVGTNEKGASHPSWEDNLGYALTLQTMLADLYPGIMRAVNLRGASFNEQYTPYSLLIEVGASGNTLTEAKRAAAVLGEAVADEIFGNN